MKIFTKRECPLCSDGTTKEVISPDINPDDNIEKIGNYWRGFYKDKLFFPYSCLLYTSPSPRDRQKSRMPSSA